MSTIESLASYYVWLFTACSQVRSGPRSRAWDQAGNGDSGWLFRGANQWHRGRLLAPPRFTLRERAKRLALPAEAALVRAGGEQASRDRPDQSFRPEHLGEARPAVLLLELGRRFTPQEHAAEAAADARGRPVERGRIVLAHEGVQRRDLERHSGRADGTGDRYGLRLAHGWLFDIMNKRPA